MTSRWKLFFGLACRKIWLQRNEVVFKKGNPEAPGSVKQLYQQVHEVIMAIDILNESGLGKVFKVEMSNRWRPLEFGWIKLNTDGACNNGGNAVATGCVIRDWSSSWVKGFCHNLMSGGVISSKLWGILDGLQLT